MTTEWNLRDEGLWKIGVVGEKAMSVTGIDEVYADLLRHSDGRPSVVQLAAFNGHADAVRYRISPPPEASYSDAIKALRLARAPGALSMVRLTAIGRDVVVQWTDAGQASRMVVSGRDPTLFRAGGRDCELLDFYFLRLPRPIRADGRNPVIVTARVKTDSLPTAVEAGEIARTIQHLTGQQAVTVDIRTDTWFIWEAPLWDPFTRAADQVPPSHEQYVAHGGIFCTEETRPGLRCSPVWFPDK
jgi:hypothetical protein